MQATAVVLVVFLFTVIISSCMTLANLSTEQQKVYNHTMLWGSYRPGVFFGMKTRSVKPMITGLIWNQGDSPRGIESMRHQSEMNEHIRYGWNMHDGKSFGVQTITDDENAVVISTEMIKSTGSGSDLAKGGDWRVRVTGKQRSKSSSHGDHPEHSKYISLCFYWAFENDEDASLRVSGLQGTRSKGLPSPIVMTGENEDLGSFSVFVKDALTTSNAPEVSQNFNFLGLKVSPKDVWKAKDFVQQSLRTSYRNQYNEQIEKLSGTHEEHPKLKPIFAKLPNQMESNSNIFIIQKIVRAPFELDIAFLSDELHPDFYSVAEVADESDKLLGTFAQDLQDKKKQFTEEFESVFLNNGQYSSTQKEMAMFGLSNMIGALGYFYGDSYHKFGSQDPIVAQPYPLFSAVPARSFFPRGFLWDEGFHQLLISRWDKEISKDIISHWFNSMTKVGWIPREQILGDESRSRVPQEFQVQHDTHANPPMLFITIHNLMIALQKQEQLIDSQIADVQLQVGDKSQIESGKEYLRNIYPLLLKNYQWIVKTQKGSKPNSYMWRGRTPGHTLASGLDDYPRGNEDPQTSERHLDLYCWVYMMTDVLQQMRDYLSIETDKTELRETLTTMKTDLKKHHWNPVINWYSDYAGLPTVNETRNEYSDHIGYVSLFPLLFGLVDIESDEIETIFNYISDSKYLWTNFGLRSLSASDPLAGTKENYWRGPIWMNINYLTLRALHKNIVRDRPTSEEKVENRRQRAKKIYTDLRNNLIQNLSSNFARFRTFHEQYSPFDGKGERAYPFTGWTTLIIPIMAEMF